MLFVFHRARKAAEARAAAEVLAKASATVVAPPAPTASSDTKPTQHPAQMQHRPHGRRP